jgi:hypothetical protein
MHYTRMQFKNKWSKLKAEYFYWKTLLRQTSIGWDETMQNINMPKSWWKKARKVSFFFEMIFFYLCVMLEKICDILSNFIEMIY